MQTTTPPKPITQSPAVPWRAPENPPVRPLMQGKKSLNMRSRTPVFYPSCPGALVDRQGPVATKYLGASQATERTTHRPRSRFVPARYTGNN